MALQIQSLIQELKQKAQQIQSRLDSQKEYQKKCFILQIPKLPQIKILTFLDSSELQCINLTCLHFRYLVGNRYLNTQYTKQLNCKIQKIKENYEQKQSPEEEEKSMAEVKNMDKEQLIKEIKKSKAIIDKVVKMLKAQDLHVKQKEEEITQMQNQLRVSQNLQQKYQQRVQDLQNQLWEVNKEHQIEISKIENVAKQKKIDIEDLKSQVKQITGKIQHNKDKKLYFKQQLSKEKKEIWKQSEQNQLFKKAFAQLKHSFCTYTVPAFEKIIQKSKEQSNQEKEHENEN